MKENKKITIFSLQISFLLNESLKILIFTWSKDAKTSKATLHLKTLEITILWTFYLVSMCDVCDSQAHNFLSVLSDQKNISTENKMIFQHVQICCSNMFHKMVFCDMDKKDFFMMLLLVVQYASIFGSWCNWSY